MSPPIATGNKAIFAFTRSPGVADSPRATDAAGCASSIRNRDWTSTDFGAVSEWPAVLAALVDTILGSRLPIALLWGVRSALLYNDAFAVAIPDAHHPGALGRPLAEAWPGLAAASTDAIERALRGETVSARMPPFTGESNRERAIGALDLLFTPVRDASGGIVGTLAIAGPALEPGAEDGAVGMHPVSGDRIDAVGGPSRDPAIGRLLPRLAHDFNNVLQNIVGSLELARRLIQMGRAPETERFLASAASATTQAAALTGRVLGFARAEPKGETTVDLNELSSAMRPLIELALPHSIRLEQALSPESCQVLCDPFDLETVLLDLVTDAADLRSATGSLRITTHVASTDAHRNVQHHHDESRQREVLPVRHACLSIALEFDPTESGTSPAPDTSADSARSGFRFARSVAGAERFARRHHGYATHTDSSGRSSVSVCLPMLAAD